MLGLALAYGGIAQLLAGMWEFRTGNTFGAVAFCSFGAFWISFWALNVFYAKEIGGNVGHAVGLYLWAWAIFTAYMTVAALRTSGAVLLVFVLLTATFVLLAIGEAGAHETVTHWGGYVGLATAAAAWYASFAAVVNSTFGRTCAGRPARARAGRGAPDPTAVARSGRRAGPGGAGETNGPGQSGELEREERSDGDRTGHAETRRRSTAELAELLDVETLRAAGRVSRARAAERPGGLRAGRRRPAGAGGSRRPSSSTGSSRGRACSTTTNPPFYKWFTGGTLNVSYNCLDRHVDRRPRRSRRLPLARRGRQRARHHLRRAARRRRALRQRAEGPRRAARATSSASTCR